MTTRRTFIAGTALAAASLACRKTAFAQPGQGTPREADFLFVQSAKGMTFDKGTGKLTLTGVSPVTVFFTDRPERIAGRMKTAAFVPLWSAGPDSFKGDPPNADVSLLEGSTLRQVVVVLKDPVLQGDELTYAVEVLEGEMPANGADVSVFIDVIGMPLTPLSFAGAARRARRRAWRRAYWYP